MTTKVTLEKEDSMAKYAAFHFTYGYDHGKGQGAYTTIEGPGMTEEIARGIQIALNSDQWCTSYPDDARWRRMVERYNMERVQKVQVSD